MALHVSGEFVLETLDPLGEEYGCPTGDTLLWYFYPEHQLVAIPALPSVE